MADDINNQEMIDYHFFEATIKFHALDTAFLMISASENNSGLGDHLA
jgi:hypothetical protein